MSARRVTPKLVEEALAKQAAAERALAAERARHEPWVAGTDFACVIAFTLHELGRVVEWLAWAEELGGCPRHRGVLAAPPDLPEEFEAVLKLAAQKVFATVDVARRPFAMPQEHWPVGPNWSFWCAAQFCHERRWDFWWNEPDCIPLRPGWLDELARAYRGCGMPFMGKIEPAGKQHPEHLTGCACYPWDTYTRLRTEEFFAAWDVHSGARFREEAAETHLVQQAWGEMGQPPAFRTGADLAQLDARAAVFHRNKDGGLIRLLRNRR